jgi:hypothetical protein
MYEDKQKLQRVLGYLKGTVDRTLLLRTSKCKNEIVAYILTRRTQYIRIQNPIVE